MPDYLYAKVAPRLNAVLLDSAVIMLFVVFMLVMSDVVPRLTQGRVFGVTLILAVLLYEPVSVASWGGTLGHRFRNLRVARVSDGKNLGFVLALSRWALKAFLGFFSFLSMLLSSRNQALHDIATGSMVVARDPRTARARHFDRHRAPQRPNDDSPGDPTE